MVKRFLVTTALEETWPKDPKIPVLFLGEWCRIYSRRERWSKMNAEVLPYHWDDREKLFNDYQYLSDLYEITLQTLQKQLNEIHGVDHSLRYWRILIGPWLGYFIQMVFDRWAMLKHTFDKYEISGCIILKNDENILIPNDMEDFNSLLVDDDWNEMIYSELLREYLKYDILIE
ncbi:MAG: LIC12162 family transferase, partial [Fidelibacterota bacterium]